MSDYKRRVSSTATVEACYKVDLDVTKRKRGKKKCLDIFGLAAGGQMYDSCDLKLLIISLISLIRVQKIYRDADSPRVCTAPSRFSLINPGVF